MSYTCAECAVMACFKGGKEDMDKLPKNCPMRNEEKCAESLAAYDEKTREFYAPTCNAKSDWNRVREIIEFCRAMNYRRIGIAFCQGLKRETKVFADILRKRGFEVVSVVCRNGGYTEAEVMADESREKDFFVSVCNPAGQAVFLAEANVDFIVEIGLCVGHDSIFFREIAKRSDAMVTVLATKDKALGHNPCAALYGAEGFFRGRFGDPLAPKE